jgi:hypothetical protein
MDGAELPSALPTTASAIPRAGAVSFGDKFRRSTRDCSEVSDQKVCPKWLTRHCSAMAGKRCLGHPTNARPMPSLARALVRIKAWQERRDDASEVASVSSGPDARFLRTTRPNR